MTPFLMWCDPKEDRKRPLADRIADAADRFREKFNTAPAICYVNPAQFDATEAAGVELRPATAGSNPVPPWHLKIVGGEK